MVAAMTLITDVWSGYFSLPLWQQAVIFGILLATVIKLWGTLVSILDVVYRLTFGNLREFPLLVATAIIAAAIYYFMRMG